MKRLSRIFLKVELYDLYLKQLAVKGFKNQHNIVSLIKLNSYNHLPPLPLYDLLLKLEFTQLSTVNEALRHRPQDYEVSELVRKGCQIVSKSVESQINGQQQQNDLQKNYDFRNLESSKISFLLNEIQRVPSFDFKAFLAQPTNSHNFLQIHRFVFPDCTLGLARLMLKRDCQEWRTVCEPVWKVRKLLSKDDQLWLSSQLGH